MLLVESKISAGFPSVAGDYINGKLDLNSYVVKNPESTFFIRVEGDSMIEAGIYPDSILVVDRSLEPKHRDIVIAVINSDMTVKRLNLQKSGPVLAAENPKYKPIRITEDMDFSVWGVVTHCINST